MRNETEQSVNYKAGLKRKSESKKVCSKAQKATVIADLTRNDGNLFC